MEFKKGTLVKWYESYADGIGFTRDTGHGVIIEKFAYTVMDKPYVLYEVYRTKFQDTMRFEECELEILNETS